MPSSIKKLTVKEVNINLKNMAEWSLEKNTIVKNFKFKNFKESIEFVTKVGDISENINHHPDISFGWGYCKIKITTHDLKALSSKDFDLATKIDNINAFTHRS